MVSAKLGARRALEDIVEHIIAILDQIDGDPDLEIEPLEEQHDIEVADYIGGRASRAFVLAETSRRQRALHH